MAVRQGNVTCKNSACGHKFTVSMPEKAGIYQYECPKCKQPIKVKISQYGKREKSDTEHSTEWISRPTEPSIIKNGLIGKLRQKGRFLFPPVEYTLQVGKNIIGRYDKDKKSDINRRWDRFMSRRSAEITVIPSENQKGYLYQFKVLNATNKVFLNKKEIGKDESVYLKYDDVIQLGRTKLTFVETKNE